jgi:FMN-dependent dehydrogenase
MDAQMDGIFVSSMVRPTRSYDTPLPALPLMPGRTGCPSSWTGGRQVDGAIGSFTALEKITRSSRMHLAQRQGKFTVLFDSGIRQGCDVLKAVAMGAQGVLGELWVHFSGKRRRRLEASEVF